MYKLVIKTNDEEIEVELNDISELRQALEPYEKDYYEINVTMIEEKVKKLVR